MPTQIKNKLPHSPFYYATVMLLISAVIAIAVFFTVLKPVNGNIYFMAKVMGPVTNIYSTDMTGVLTKLTDNLLWRDIEPDVSAGGKVVFASNRYDNPKVDLRKQAEDYNIFIMDKNGGHIRQMTDSPDHEIKPKISPTGKQLAYLVRKSGEYELAVAAIDGSDTAVLARAVEIFDFSWSPDGTTLCYAEINQQSSSLNTVNVADKKIHTLVTTASITAAEESNRKPPNLLQIASPAWSPDGRHIAYIRHPLDKSARQLYVYAFEKKRDYPVSINSVHVQSPVSWSKNSESLLYSALVDYKFYYDETAHRKVYAGGMHIFISDLNGNNQKITSGDHLYKYPVFSPDEKHIAFLYADALDTRTLSLRIMKPDGTDLKELHDSVAQRSLVIWR